MQQLALYKSFTYLLTYLYATVGDHFYDISVE